MTPLEQKIKAAELRLEVAQNRHRRTAESLEAARMSREKLIAEKTETES